MKIAIPVDEKSLESNVCVSFGRAPYFLIYDTESKVHCSNLGVSALRNAINNYLVVKRMEDSYENSNSGR